MRRSRFSRDSTAAAAYSTVRFRTWALKQHPRCHNMYLCHPRPLCNHRRPCWQRSRRPCMAPLVEPLPFGPATAANAPRRGILQRAWPCALRCHHRSAHIAELFVRLGTSPCCRRRRRRRSGGSSSRPPVAKRICGPVHQLALACALERAPKMHLRPRAICGHPAKSSRDTKHMAQAPFCSPNLNLSR